MCLLSRLDEERSCGASWSTYFVRIPKGKNLELERPNRLLQSWRTSDFEQNDTDSRLEILFEKDGDGTRVTLVHTDIPEGQGKNYESGGVDSYIDPMDRFFG